MNKFSTALCILGLATPFYNAQAAAHLESCMPENSFVLMSVSDYSDFTKKCDDSPINELVNDAKIREVIKPLTDYASHLINEKEDKPLIAWEDIKAHLDGQIILSMDISKMKADDSEKVPSIVMLANLKDSDGFVDMITSRLEDQEDFKDSIGSLADNEKFQKVTIHHFIVKDDTTDKSSSDDEGDGEDEKPSKTNQDIYFGTVAKTFFLTLNKSAAKDVIEALKGKEEGTLAEGPVLSPLLAQTEGKDAYVFINAKPLQDLIEAAIRRDMGNDDGSEPNPLKPTPDAVISALGLGSIKNAFVGLTIERDNVHVDSNISADSSVGIGRLLRAYGQSYATPNFVPESAVSVNASGFNLGTLFTELRQIVFTAAPSFSIIYQAQMAQLQQQTGVDTEKDLIGNFDDGLVCFSMDNADAVPQTLENSQQIFALKIKDSVSFKRSLDAVLAKTPLAQKMVRRDFSGTELIIFNGNKATPVFSMAQKDSWLLMSTNPTCLQNAISSSDTQKSFWQSKTYTELGDGKLPDGGMAVSYNDFDALVKTVLYSVATIYNVSAPVVSGESKPIDTKLIGEIKDMPFSVCGKAFKTPDGYKANSYLIKK